MGGPAIRDGLVLWLFGSCVGGRIAAVRLRC